MAHQRSRPSFVLLLAPLLLLIILATCLLWSQTPGHGHPRNTGRLYDTPYLLHPEAQAGLDNFTHARLDRRALGDPQQYGWAIEKRQGYICRLKANPEPEDASKFLNYADLEKSEWTRTVTEKSKTETALKSISVMLKAMGFSDSIDPKGPMHDITWTHKKTGASYRKIYNPSQGVVLAINNRSPAYMAAKKSISSSNIPSLQQWSDVTFLELANLATSQELKKLRYIARFNIVDTPAPTPNPRHIAETNEIIACAIVNKLGPMSTPQNWAGSLFRNVPDLEKKVKEAFEALMGTPHLTAVVWLLMQHREAMGRKTVKSIQVWNADRSKGSLSSWRGKACMLIELQEVQA